MYYHTEEMIPDKAKLIKLISLQNTKLPNTSFKTKTVYI